MVMNSDTKVTVTVRRFDVSGVGSSEDMLLTFRSEGIEYVVPFSSVTDIDIETSGYGYGYGHVSRVYAITFEHPFDFAKVVEP